MKEKLLSIIIPVYNVEKYLERCLKSIEPFMQEEVEIILVNDGSTDSSSEICNNFGRNSNVKVIHKENGGLSDARNVGLIHATGKYIWFVDSDDAVYPIYSKLRKLLYESCSEIIVLDYIMEINGYQVEKSHTSLVEDRIYTSSYYLKKVLESHEYYVPVWSYVFLREIFLQGRFSFRKGIYHEDEQLTPYLLLYANSIVAFKEKGYHYFVRDNSIATNKCGKKNVQDLFAIFKENAHFFETKVSDVPLKKLLLNDIVEKMIYVLCRYRVRKQEQRRYIDKHFLFKHALGVKNKARVLIFVYFFSIYQYLYGMNEKRKCGR